MADGLHAYRLATLPVKSKVAQRRNPLRETAGGTGDLIVSEGQQNTPVARADADDRAYNS
jgi:hypothetical protein